jgi:hypothetical protein
MSTYTSIINPKVSLDNETHLRFFFDQYKIFIDGNSKLEEQRRNLNIFYLTANTLIISTLSSLVGKPNFHIFFLMGLLLFGGITTTLSWVSAINVYKSINNKNYAVILEFEQYFPAQVYTSFNKDISRLDPLSKGRNFMVQREIIVPYVFLIGYVIYIVFNILKHTWSF